jgi:3-phosphoshikimate 1-carboxyvinyltransferase
MSEARTIVKASRLQGEVRVPGELRTAAQAFWLAAISEGESHFDYVPTTAHATLEILTSLGVGVQLDNRTATITGVGLRGLRQPPEIIELDVPMAAALPALAILSQQSFVSRVRVAADCRDAALQLLALLAPQGAASSEESEGLLRLEGTQDPAGATYQESDLSGPVKLGLLTAGLFAGTPTVVRESPSSKDRVDALLKTRGVSVEGSRQADPTVRTITLRPGPVPKALDVDLAGDLAKALPFIVAGVSVRRSAVTVRRVMLRPENRVLIDILRQNGAEMEIVDNADGSVDLALKGSARMKPTRVADKRAENLLDHVALVAVLATQTEGQFIIRDVESLRQGEFDFIEHLAVQLRAIQAKVGEYPYGLVIDGGRPLQGARIQTNGHAGMAQAFAVAGLLANGGMEIDDTECVEPEFPGFFDELAALQSSKTKEKTK